MSLLYGFFLILKPIQSRALPTLSIDRAVICTGTDAPQTTVIVFCSADKAADVIVCFVCLGFLRIFNAL